MKRVVISAESPEVEKAFADLNTPFEFRLGLVAYNPSQELSHIDYAHKISSDLAEGAFPDKETTSIGVTTIVFVNGYKLKKPKHAKQLRELLFYLKTRPHSFVTSYTLISHQLENKISEAEELTVGPVTDRQIISEYSNSQNANNQLREKPDEENFFKYSLIASAVSEALNRHAVDVVNSEEDVVGDTRDLARKKRAAPLVSLAFGAKVRGGRNKSTLFRSGDSLLVAEDKKVRNEDGLDNQDTVNLEQEEEQRSNTHNDKDEANEFERDHLSYSIQNNRKSQLENGKSSNSSKHNDSKSENETKDKNRDSENKKVKQGLMDYEKREMILGKISSVVGIVQLFSAGGFMFRFVFTLIAGVIAFALIFGLMAF